MKEYYKELEEMERVTKLNNGWDLILDQDYNEYVVFIDTHEKHPTEDKWLLLAQSYFKTLEKAEEEFNRLRKRYNNYITAKCGKEDNNYYVELTYLGNSFKVKSIISLIEPTDGTSYIKEVYIHQSDVIKHDFLFDFLEEDKRQSFRDSWVLLFSIPYNNEEEVTLFNKPKEQYIFI